MNSDCEQQDKTSFRKVSLFCYSVIAAPLAFAGLPLYVHMPDFYIRSLGLPISLAGVLLLVIRFLDAISDPVIGYVSDKFHVYRWRIIAFGITLLVAGMAGLCMRFESSIPLAWWFAFFIFIATMGYSIVAINITMLGGLWCKAEVHRARISVWREAFGLLGLLLAAVLPTVLQIHLPPQRAFNYFFLVFVSLVIFSSWAFKKFIKDFLLCNAEQSNSSDNRHSHLVLIQNLPMKFWLACFFSYLSSAVPAVLALFFIRDYLGLEYFAGGFLALYFISGASFIGVWVKVTKKQGVLKSWLVAMILSVVTFMGAVFLSPGDSLAYAIVCMAAGVALGGDLALPPAILAGYIQKQALNSQAAQYYAILAFLSKLSLALAAGVALWVLGQVGLQAGQANTVFALKILLILYALLPCVLKLLASGVLFWLIRTDKDSYEIDKRSTDYGAARIT